MLPPPAMAVANDDQLVQQLMLALQPARQCNPFAQQFFGVPLGHGGALAPLGHGGASAILQLQLQRQLQMGANNLPF